VKNTAGCLPFAQSARGPCAELLRALAQQCRSGLRSAVAPDAVEQLDRIATSALVRASVIHPA
jgi:hypothetical protein